MENAHRSKAASGPRAPNPAVTRQRFVAAGLYVASWSVFILFIFSRHGGSFLEFEVAALLLTSVAVGILVAQWWALALPLAVASWMLTPLPYEGETDFGVVLAVGLAFVTIAEFGALVGISGIKVYRRWL